MIRGALNFVGLAVILTCSDTAAGAAQKTERVIARLAGDVDDRTIQLSIVEYHDRELGDRLLRRKTDITCTRKCDGFRGDSFEIDDLPLGLYRPIADGRDFITVWEGATSFHVIVYRITDHAPLIVLDRYSKTSPALSVDDIGIRIELSDTSDPPFQYTHRCVWHDGQKSYTLLLGNAKNCE